MYDMGQYVRAKYGNFEPASTYFQSTFKQRTIDSARACMDGLFNKPLSWPHLSVSTPVNVIPEMSDYLIHVSEENCPRFAQVMDAVENHPRT
jgi:hypothetical protein